VCGIVETELGGGIKIEMLRQQFETRRLRSLSETVIIWSIKVVPFESN